MMSRRDALISGVCVVAAATAYGLKPRKRVSLQGSMRLEQIVPMQFGQWESRDVTDLVAPTTPDSLEARLYNETVGRVYAHTASSMQVMMLLAHGDTQSNGLQVHRPEVCYPAFGFAIEHSEPVTLALAPGVDLPSRRLIAQAPQRREHIIYWARLGEFLPVTGTEQRLDRLATSVHGIVADGLLARFSIIGADAGVIFPFLSTFIVDLIHAVRADHRVGLIGSARARALASIED
jgi:EpsI family protein